MKRAIEHKTKCSKRVSKSELLQIRSPLNFACINKEKKILSITNILTYLNAVSMKKNELFDSDNQESNNLIYNN